MRCDACGTELSSRRLTCPACHRLVHVEELTRLADVAARAREDGDIGQELSTWRSALELLPSNADQHRVITKRASELSRQQEAQPNAEPPSVASADASDSTARRWWMGAGALGLLVWKLKAVIAFVLTKGKLVFLGLTKSATLFSMLASLGVYWVAFGWEFALGIIVSIYLHEMGHVAALHRLGIRASSPMFIPGVGAFVRLEQYPVDVREDARVGLAGPLWGLATALAAWGVFVLTGSPIWGAIARIGAWINLFNLLPVWQLDGSRGFRALTQSQGFVVVAAIGVCWFWTEESLLFILLVFAMWRAWRATEETGDTVALVQFIILIVALSALTLIDVPIGPIDASAAIE